MVDEEVKKLIEENPVAIATVTEGNKPNVIGVAYVKVVSDDQLVITDNYMKKTIDDIQENNNVCLVCWDSDMNGCKLIGTAEYFTEGKWLDFVKNLEENKEEPAKGAILVTVTRVIKSA
ncbi:pyridoxamine 5'-phosphate oxidase family protein [Nanoarchaeota archaeon]